MRYGFTNAALAIAIGLVGVGSAQEPGQRYGGIELGSTGIKPTAIEIVVKDGKRVVKLLKFPEEIQNAGLARLKGKLLREAALEDAAAAVRFYYEAMTTQLSIPVSHISVVASSGMPRTADYPELKARVLTASGLTMNHIDAAEESRLTALAMIPPDRRGDTLLIDVGGGNIKGGAFVGGKFEYFEVKAGLNVLVAMGEETAREGILELGGAIKAAAGARVRAAIAKQLEAHPEFLKRPRVLLTGGAVYACATLVKPASVVEGSPTIARADVAAFGDVVDSAPVKTYPKATLPEGLSADALKEVKNVLGEAAANRPFKPENLRAAAAILAVLFDEFKLDAKQVKFGRNALLAWITAYVTPEKDLPNLYVTFATNEAAKPVKVAIAAPTPTEPMVVVVPNTTPAAPAAPTNSTPVLEAVRTVARTEPAVSTQPAAAENVPGYYAYPAYYPYYPYYYPGYSYYAYPAYYPGYSYVYPGYASYYPAYTNYYPAYNYPGYYYPNYGYSGYYYPGYYYPAAPFPQYGHPYSYYYYGDTIRPFVYSWYPYGTYYPYYPAYPVFVR